MTPEEVADLATSALARDRLTDHPAGDAIVVDLRRASMAPAPPGLVDALLIIPRVFVAVTGSCDARPTPGTLAAALDVTVVGDEAAAELANRVAQAPLAAGAAAALLRGSEDRSIAAGLVVESVTYSMLQAGPEHLRWLAGRTPRTRLPQRGPVVRVAREGNRLLLTLARPQVRNAFDARMREELLAGLLVAAEDETIAEVVINGEGSSFCSGGDLDEFGSKEDPASAHALRLARSAGRAIAALSARVTAHVHGACAGAGVELPAFAGRVIAAPDTTFRLPELDMGLVPGAGGTVSLPQRIGRHRTAWLALSGRAIDAPTAAAWGLVDEVPPD
ncbi:MAG: enoyl-CoA hydratase/isomerase family protein [Acidimicrobiales bacterium]